MKDIAPWGAEGKKTLSWFGLSDGFYWIETSAGRLLEGAPLRCCDDAPPFRRDEELYCCGYQVVRLFEDLLDTATYIHDPAPDDVITFFVQYFARATHKTQATIADLPEAMQFWQARHRTFSRPSALFEDDTFRDSIDWWRQRGLDTCYLSTQPRLNFCRQGDDLHVFWRADPTWSVVKADLVLPDEHGRQAIEDFVAAFLQAMAERVRDIAEYGWKGSDCFIDMPHLIAEQPWREEQARQFLARNERTDWDLVRQSCKILSA